MHNVHCHKDNIFGYSKEGTNNHRLLLAIQTITRMCPTRFSCTSAPLDIPAMKLELHEQSTTNVNLSQGLEVNNNNNKWSK